MKAEEIIELYDSNPNITLKQLSGWTGLTIPELKRILMS